MFNDLAPVIESYVTAGALLATGIWAYLAFIRQRIRYPRLATTINSVAIKVDGIWVLRIDVRIENIGSILVKVEKANLRLRQVVPLPTEVIEKVSKGSDPVGDKDSQVLWPCLAERNWNGIEQGLEIEPGETECLHADFFVPDFVEVVEYYLYLANDAKNKTGIGWSETKVQELGGHEKVSNG